MISIQKLRCQTQEDTSLLGSKDQTFNYFKSILQHEMFAGTQEAVSQIRWWHKLHTPQPLRHPTVTVPREKVYHAAKTTALELLMTLPMKSLQLLRQWFLNAESTVLSVNATKHSVHVPPHPTWDKASSCSLLNRCIVFLNESLKKGVFTWVLSGS